MSEWNLSVPKRVFFYWGGEKLSFLRFMSIYSFKKLNPDWEVCFYTPLMLNAESKWGDKQFENRSKIVDYTRSISTLLGIKPIIFDFEKIGLSNTMNEVHKSDFIRYYLISSQGGVWSDMDILYIKPMTELYHNKAKSEYKSFYFYDGRGIWKHAIGFLMGEKGSEYFSDAFEMAKDKFDNEGYQVIGAEMLNDNFGPKRIKEKYPNATSLDVDSVYCINHDHHKFLYNKPGKHMITDNAVGIHWYGGSRNVKNLIMNVNHKNFNNYNNQGTVMLYMKELFGNDFKDVS